MRFLVFQHSEIDVPGVFGEVMQDAGIEWDPIEPYRGEAFPSLDGYDAVVAMGGPQQTDEEARFPWLADEKALLRDAVAGDVPVFGVCLGCQLLADAHGGTVAPLAEAEIGIIDFALTDAGRADPLFAGLPPSPLTMQWHLNAVTALPSGATHLARSPACEVQAFRIGKRGYGVQFHMEVNKDLVRGVDGFPEYVAALEDLRGVGAFDRLVAETGRHEETLRTNGRQLFANFVGMVDETNATMAAG